MAGYLCLHVLPRRHFPFTLKPVASSSSTLRVIQFGLQILLILMATSHNRPCDEVICLLSDDEVSLPGLQIENTSQSVIEKNRKGKGKEGLRGQYVYRGFSYCLASLMSLGAFR